MKIQFSSWSFLLVIGILFVLWVGSAGCKMGYSFTGASIPIEAKTISISYFTNNSSLAPPTLSQQFTEALKDICSNQTRLGLVAKGGDLTFEGYIVDYKVTPLAIQSNDQAALNRLTITVQVKYSNKFDSKKSFEATFSKFADYSSSKSLSSVESSLIPQINQLLTDEIFNRAFSNW